MGERDAVLVVDDDPDVALLLSDFLEREGYPVAVAPTGSEGLRLLREGSFALVLLDLNLPDADAAAASLHDPRSGNLTPAAAYHVPKEFLATLSTLPLPLKEQGFFLSLWADRRPVHTDDVAHDERFTHAVFRSFPHQSGLLLPLIVDDEVIGGFYVVWWTTRRRFTERELRALDHVCEQVGSFLRNARRYEDAERNRHRLEVLNDVSRRLAAVHDTEEVLTVIVNEAARLVDAEAAGLRRPDGADPVVAPRPAPARAAGRRGPLGRLRSSGAGGGRLRPGRGFPGARRRPRARARAPGPRRRGSRVPPAADARRRSVLRDAEEPPPGRGAVRRGPGIGV